MVQEIDKNGNLMKNNFVFIIFLLHMSPSPYSFPTKYRSVESFSPTPEVWENADARERMRIVIDGVADATAFLMTRFTNGIPIISTQSELSLIHI